MNFNVEVIATAIGTFLAGAYICYKVCRQKIEQFLKSWQGSVSSKVPKQSQVDIKVLNRMEEVKELMDADRVHVYEFHNGEHYANGRSALKVSCTYEVCRIGVHSIQRESMSIPTNHRHNRTARFAEKSCVCLFMTVKSYADARKAPLVKELSRRCAA